MGVDGQRPESAVFAERLIENLADDQVKTAALLLSAAEDDMGDLTDPKMNKLLAELRRCDGTAANTPEGGWKVPSAGVNWASNWSRGQARRLMGQLRRLATEEEKIREALLSPAADAAAEAGVAPGPRPAALRTKEERLDDRLATGMVWHNAQNPAPRDPLHMPSKGAVGCFTLFENGLAPPPLPSFTEVVAKGRQQEIIKGRESPLSDFICVLLAMAIAYAGPLPDGAPVSEVDKASLEVMDESSRVKKKVVPALAASTVDHAIDQVTAALGPLAPEQQEELSKSLWNELIAQHAARRGSLTQALAATMRMARKTKRKAPPPRDKGPKDKGPKDKAPRWEGKAICPTWKRDGECANFRARKCQDYRHPPEFKKAAAAAPAAPAPAAAAP